MKIAALYRLSIFFLCVTAASGAQKSNSRMLPPAAHKLVAVKVTGSERYTEKEIVPASGLEIGQNVDEADFKEAVRRLGDSGLFTAINYSYTFSPTGTKVDFQLKDTESNKLLPAHFENFVWFSDAELKAQLLRLVPLFKDVLPIEGGLPDKVTEALQALIDEKKIPGHVSYLREAPVEGGELTAFAYSVEDLAIVIREIEFPGAGPDQLPPLRAASRKILGAHYFRSSLGVVAKVDLLPVYLQRGYLKAVFAPTEAHVDSENEGDVEVTALFPVTPGKVYSVSDVHWSGNSALPTNQLQPLLHLPAGQPADAVRLVRDLESVTKLYRAHGYMKAAVQADPQMDDEKSTVRYELNAAEGAQYKMGELELIGLDSQSTARLQEAWGLKEGEPYNADYATKFLDDNTKLLPGGVRWGVSVHETVNDQDKTVDLTIHFNPR